MTLDFIDTRLSDQVAYGFAGGPSWNTRITPRRNGYENRNGNWSMPLHRYSVDYGRLKEELQADLLQALWVARGALRTFRFKDWNDFEAIAQPLPAPATSTSPIQLQRTYAFGPDTLVRPITLPISGDRALQILADGEPFADCTIDPLTGLATPTSAWPDAALTWEGEFDVRVRFEQDYYTLTRARPKVSTATVTLLEVRA